MPRQSKLPAPQVLADMMVGGKMQADIAAEYGATCSAVSRRLTGAGLSGREMERRRTASKHAAAGYAKRRLKLQRTVAKYALYLAAREEGLTYRRIAELFGVSRTTARVSFKKARTALAELQSAPSAQTDYADQFEHFIARIAA
jgi:predicted transcriptional regulator